MVQINNNIKYVIGIDFGHGETATAIYDILQEKVDKINIIPGHDVVPSAVAIIMQEGKENVVIGEEAVDWIGHAKKFQVSFKKLPSQMNTSERFMMISFMKGVYNGIRCQNVTLNDSNHVVFIARPSNHSWDTEEDEYISMAAEAGIPIAGAYKESIAAYYRARTNVMTKIDEHYKKGGVLVVDYGSSTIDFTYLNHNLTSPIVEGTKGTEYGANRVETTIMRYALENCSDSEFQKFYRLYGQDPNSSPYNGMLYQFRKSKETFYSKRTSIRLSCHADIGDITSSEKEQCYGEKTFYIAPETIKTELKSYIDDVTKAAQTFKDKYLEGKVVSLVYLTGGASRMNFVREIFGKVYKLSEDNLPPDNDPSSIVALGVAHLGYLFYAYKNKEEEFKRKRDAILNNFNWYQELYAVIFPIIKNDLKSRAHSVMYDWSQGNIKGKDEWGNYSPTVEALVTRFKSTFENYRSYDFAKQSNDVIKEKILNKIFSNIQVAFNGYGYNEKLAPQNFEVNISAKLWESGINKLINKFTGNNKGHVIFDAVDNDSVIMLDLNPQRNRSKAACKWHYNYYSRHYYSIFSDSDWDSFMKNDVNISGIESLKKTVCEYVIKETDDYIRYATMREMFGG